MTIDEFTAKIRESLDCFVGKSGVKPKQIEECVIGVMDRIGAYALRHPFFDERDVDVIRRPDGSFFCCFTPGITDWCEAQRAFLETRYD